MCRAPRRPPRSRARSRAPRPPWRSRRDRDRERAGGGGRARRGIDEVVEPPPGPNRRVSRPDVATPPPVSSRVPASRSGVRGSAMSTRHGPPSGGLPQTAMSPPRSTSAPVSAGQAARIACSARVAAKPLPMPPRSTAAPRSTRALPEPRIDVDARAGVPVLERRGSSLREQLEGAVVAGGGECREDRRVEPPARVRPRAQRLGSASMSRVVDRDPRAAGVGSGATGRCARRSARARARRPRPRAARPSSARRAIGRRRASRTAAATAQIVPIARNASRCRRGSCRHRRGAARLRRRRRRPSRVRTPAAGRRLAGLRRAASGCARRRARRPGPRRRRRRSGPALR